MSKEYWTNAERKLRDNIKLLEAKICESEEERERVRSDIRGLKKLVESLRERYTTERIETK